MALSAEIHVPASPNPRYANMLFFLAASLARNAGLPGPWTLVVALGRDGSLTPDSPELAWARDLPVEFRPADAALWEAFGAEAKRRQRPDHVHNATILRQLDQPYAADVVLFLDADTVVTRSLAPLIAEVEAGDLLAAKPAWQPPDIDLDAMLGRAGLRFDGPPITYSGWGWSFLAPKHAPPYLNSGVTVCSNRTANLLQRDLARDFAWIDEQYLGRYGWQVAQCLTIVRNRIACLSLDERYNIGIGAPAPSILPGAEGALLDALGEEQARDARVIHYCTPARHFVRNRTMGDDALLRAFLDEANLDEGERMLQSALLPFRDAWEGRMEGR